MWPRGLVSRQEAAVSKNVFAVGLGVDKVLLRLSIQMRFSLGAENGPVVDAAAAAVGDDATVRSRLSAHWLRIMISNIGT